MGKDLTVYLDKNKILTFLYNGAIMCGIDI